MKAIQKIFVCGVLVALSQASVWSASAKRLDKLAPDLLSSMSVAHEQRVIVTYAPGLDAPNVQALVSKSGRAARHVAGSSAIAARLSRREIESLASDSRVLSISPDRKVTATMDIAVPTIGADRLAQYLGYTGRGVTVAVVDSGLAPSAAVAQSRVLASVDFTGSRGSADAFGHGTHVAGTIAGSGAKGSVRGVAPDASVVSLKVLDGQGQGYVSNVIDAIEWAIAHRNAYGIRVLNLSFGHPPAEAYRTDPLAHAVERAWAAGLAVVAFSGNRG